MFLKKKPDYPSHLGRIMGAKYIGAARSVFFFLIFFLKDINVDALDRLQD